MAFLCVFLCLSYFVRCFCFFLRCLLNVQLVRTNKSMCKLRQIQTKQKENKNEKLKNMCLLFLPYVSYVCSMCLPNLDAVLLFLTTLSGSLTPSTQVYINSFRSLEAGDLIWNKLQLGDVAGTHKIMEIGGCEQTVPGGFFHGHKPLRSKKNTPACEIWYCSSPPTTSKKLLGGRHHRY